MKLVEYLIQHKKYPADFALSFDGLSIDKPIEDFAEHIFKIYNIGYSGNKYVRKTHGISHVCRVAYYVRVFANLYELQNPSYKLSDVEIKCIQIAGLLHDAGREADGYDCWDKDSGTITFLYLREVAGVDISLAISAAHAVVNKDFISLGSNSDFFSFNLLGQGVQWYIVSPGSRPLEKNILYKILHDADCLDVIRVRSKFDAKFLDYVTEFNVKNNNDLKNIIHNLHVEARSLIHHCGDTYRLVDHKDVSRFRGKDTYGQIKRLIAEQNSHSKFSFLRTFYHPIDNNILSGMLENKVFDDKEDEIINAYQSGVNADGIDHKIVIFRGVVAPSDERHIFTPEVFGKGSYAANSELSFMHQRSVISDNRPNGNSWRSVSVLLPGSGVYSSVGFLDIIDSYRNLDLIFPNGNGGTGRGEKNFSAVASQRCIENDFLSLKNSLALGGCSSAEGYLHTEVLVNFSKARAIAYTNDPNRGNAMITGIFEYRQPRIGVPLLEAIFLHQAYCIHVANLPRSDVYDLQSENINLPIYEYSGIHGMLRKIDFPNAEEILSVWKSIFNTYVIDIKNNDILIKTVDVVKNIIENKVAENLLIKDIIKRCVDLLTNEIDELIVAQCYGVKLNGNPENFQIKPLHKFYSLELKTKIRKYALFKVLEFSESFRFSDNLKLNKILYQIIYDFYGREDCNYYPLFGAVKHMYFNDKGIFLAQDSQFLPVRGCDPLKIKMKDFNYFFHPWFIKRDFANKFFKDLAFCISNALLSLKEFIHKQENRLAANQLLYMAYTLMSVVSESSRLTLNDAIEKCQYQFPELSLDSNGEYSPTISNHLCLLRKNFRVNENFMMDYVKTLFRYRHNYSFVQGIKKHVDIFLQSYLSGDGGLVAISLIKEVGKSPLDAGLVNYIFQEMISVLAEKNVNNKRPRHATFLTCYLAYLADNKNPFLQQEFLNLIAIMQKVDVNAWYLTDETRKCRYDFLLEYLGKMLPEGCGYVSKAIVPVLTILLSDENAAKNTMHFRFSEKFLEFMIDALRKYAGQNASFKTQAIQVILQIIPLIRKDYWRANMKIQPEMRANFTNFHNLLRLIEDFGVKNIEFISILEKLSEIVPLECWSMQYIVYDKTCFNRAEHSKLPISSIFNNRIFGHNVDLVSEALIKCFINICNSQQNYLNLTAVGAMKILDDVEKCLRNLSHKSLNYMLANTLHKSDESIEVHPYFFESIKSVYKFLIKLPDAELVREFWMFFWVSSIISIYVPKYIVLHGFNQNDDSDVSFDDLLTQYIDSGKNGLLYLVIRVIEESVSMGRFADLKNEMVDLLFKNNREEKHGAHVIGIEISKRLNHDDPLKNKILHGFNQNNSQSLNFFTTNNKVVASQAAVASSNPKVLQR